ncbi:hypothetical protein M8818_002968 [Zalaria obscura]|uniref:Uncharacterized protein n=1 Tax=Zalaria obscura TaxID=2024903 RepID=A0ACC3SHJ5_9PEZI
MFLFLLSNIVGSSIQITTLPLPLLSTLQASGLVFNALLASIILHEPFTLRTAVGTVLVAVGAVLISLFSALPEPSHTLDQLLQLLVVPNFIVWMSLTLLLVVAVLVGTFLLQHCISAHRRHKPRIILIRGMSYGLISGILSAHSLLLAKSAVELLVRTIVDHKNQFNRYQSWLLLLLFLFLALTQLYYLHRGLKLVTTSVLYPFVFCIYNIIAILDGLIYFRQTDRLPRLHAGLIALGTVVLLAGVLALSWRLSDDEDTAENRHSKTDLPQTALTPGMGFVNDPDSDEVDDLADGEEAELAENSPLLRRHTVYEPALVGSKKRKRRNTVREVESIWDELRDEENYYGTADAAPNGRRSFSSRRPASRSSRRVSNGAVDADAPTKALLRSRTAPVDRVKGHKRSATLPEETRPRSGTRMLPQEWFKLDWWRKRRRVEDGGECDTTGFGQRSESPDEQ